MKTNRAAGARGSKKQPKAAEDTPPPAKSRTRKPAKTSKPAATAATKTRKLTPAQMRRKVREAAAALKPPKVGKRGHRAGEWTPDKPLPIIRQENFCQRYCTGWYSGAACYRESYPDANVNSSYELASKLLRQPQILARIDYLREEAAKRVSFTKADAIQMCVGVLKTPIGALDVHSPLIEGVDRNGNPVMPSKLGTLNTLIAMQGWKAAEEVEVKLTYEAPEVALQRAAAAGVDVEALLKKVLPARSE